MDVTSPRVGATPALAFGPGFRARSRSRSTSASRAELAAPILPLLLVAQMLALGGDLPVLAVGFAGAALVCAIAVFLLAEPDLRFWKAAVPIAVLCGVTFAWHAMPLLLPALAPSRAAALVAPDLAPIGFAQWLGVVAILFAAAWIGYRRGTMRPVIEWLLALAVVQIAVGLGLRWIDPEHVWGLDKGILTQRFTGTFLNANASGCLFGVVAILGLGRLLGLMREHTTVVDEGRHQLRQMLAMVATVGGLGACAITESRVALTVTVLLLAALAGTDRMLRRLLRRPVARGLAIAAAVVVCGVVLWFGATTIERYWASGRDAVSRIDIWSHYWALARAGFGGGYGFYAGDELLLQHARDSAAATQLLYVHSPHNWLLSLLLIGGWPYALAVTAGAVAMVYGIRQHLRAATQDPVLRAIMAGLLLIVTCASIDVALDVPAIAGLAATLLGLAWGRSLHRRAGRQALGAASSSR